MNYERLSAMWIHLFSKNWMTSLFFLLWRSERWEKWSEAKEIPRCWCSWFSVEKYANRKSFPRQLSRDKQRGTFFSGFSTECEQAWCQACTSRATCCPWAFATANMGEHLRLSGRGQVPSPVVKVKASTFHWENLFEGKPWDDMRCQWCHFFESTWDPMISYDFFMDYAGVCFFIPHNSGWMNSDPWPPGRHDV